MSFKENNMSDLAVVTY